MEKSEIDAWAPDPPTPVRPGTLRQALEKHGHWTPLQIAGRHWEVACVALEITQRCNLDCSLCYLSEHSEAVRDLPLEEVFRRIDMIAQRYGPGTNVQVTGGDPTLRRRDELAAIVRRLADRGLKPALFTNGIKASRELLAELAAAGLKDVAFHVDTTQQRRGFASEAELNGVRLAYIERARGLGLHVLFNTTVTEDNIHEVPALAQFFKDRAEEVHLASFQPHADTGRGVLQKNGTDITAKAVSRLIEEGLGTKLGFDWPLIGHPDCNRYSSCLVAGKAVAPLFDAPEFLAALFVRTESIRFERHHPLRMIKQGIAVACSNLDLWPAGLAYGLRKLWQLRRGLHKGRVRKLSFHVHSFMDAGKLERARCEACVFYVMTHDGPISMCVHNAKRDAFITQPVTLPENENWYPLGAPEVPDPTNHPLKRLKGRTRQHMLNFR
ncbi:MAG: radical SAM protein [Pseudomonadota bacterium]